MNCPKCGKPLQEGAKFCMGCGQRIPRCPSCGNLLHKRAKFCMGCGTPIPDEINALLPSPVQEPAVVKEDTKTETVTPKQPEVAIPEPPEKQNVEEPVRKKVVIIPAPESKPEEKQTRQTPKQGKAEPKPVARDEQTHSAGSEKKKSKALMPILAVVAAIVLLAGGFFAGKMLFGGKENTAAQQDTVESVTEQVETEETAIATESIETIPETEAPAETEPPKILMPNCVGLTHEEAVAAFETIPCQLTFDEAYSDTVAANMILAQNLPEGCELTAEAVVLLTISKGPDVAPEGYNQKVTVTAAAGSSYGTLTLYDWENGQWVSKFMCDASLGSNGISPEYGEGRKRTPQGVFKLGVALSGDNLSNSTWPAHLVTSDTCVVDDVNSPLYNTIQSIQGLPSGTSYDPIGRTIIQGTCNVCIYIEHNGNGYTADNVVAGNGSVITICGRNPAIQPTFGCVDISASNMNNLLSMLSYEKNPHIEIYPE